MEINNTFTSLIADLPYPSSKNNQKESENLDKNATAHKAFDGLVKNDMEQKSHEKELLKDDPSNFLNILV